MKKYETPEVEVIIFMPEDITMSSPGGLEEEENGTGWTP